MKKIVIVFFQLIIFFSPISHGENWITFGDIKEGPIKSSVFLQYDEDSISFDKEFGQVNLKIVFKDEPQKYFTYELNMENKKIRSKQGIDKRNWQRINNYNSYSYWRMIKFYQNYPELREKNEKVSWKTWKFRWFLALDEGTRPYLKDEYLKGPENEKESRKMIGLYQYDEKSLQIKNGVVFIHCRLFLENKRIVHLEIEHDVKNVRYRVRLNGVWHEWIESEETETAERIIFVLTRSYWEDHQKNKPNKI